MCSNIFHSLSSIQSIATELIGAPAAVGGLVMIVGALVTRNGPDGRGDSAGGSDGSELCDASGAGGGGPRGEIGGDAGGNDAGGNDAGGNWGNVTEGASAAGGALGSESVLGGASGADAGGPFGDGGPPMALGAGGSATSVTAELSGGGMAGRLSGRGGIGGSAENGGGGSVSAGAISMSGCVPAIVGGKTSASGARCDSSFIDMSGALIGTS